MLNAFARKNGIVTDVRRALLATSAMALVCAAAPALAAEQPQTAATGALEEIVVSARRVDENLQKTPISVTALSADFLKDMNITRVQELQLVTPNLVVRDAPSNGMGTILYLRGVGAVSVQVLSDPPINIYVDGVVQSRPTGNAFDLPDIERVEVLRGPQGTLFGRNTTGGAVSIITKRPTDTFGGSAEINTGKFGEFGTTLVVNTGTLFNTNIRSKVTFQRHTNDGWVSTFGRDRSNWSGYSRNMAAAFSLAADLNDKISIDNRIYIQKIQSMPAYQMVVVNSALAQAAFNLSPTLGGPPVIVGNGPLDQYYFDTRRPYEPFARAYGNTLNVTYTASEKFQLKSITGLSGLVQKQTGQLGGSALTARVNRLVGGTLTQAVEPIETMTINNSNRQTQFTEELQAQGTIGEFNYTAGLYYYMEDIYEDLRTITPAFAGTTAAPTVNLTDLNSRYTPRTESFAGYANVGYKPEAADGRLEITAGIRYTDDKKTITRQRVTRVSNSATVTTIAPAYISNSWDNIGWNASMSLQITDDIMTYVRGSSAFRSGAYTSVPATPAVNPETAKSFEAGFKSEFFDRRLRLNGAFFKTFYDNLQVNQRNSLTSVSVVVNAGKATFTGFDLDLAANLGRGFQINGTLGHVKPRYQRYDFIAGAGATAPAGTVVNVAQYAFFPVVSHWTYNIGGQYKSEPTKWGVFTARLDYSRQSGYFTQPIGVIPAGVVQATAFTASPNNATQKTGSAVDLRANVSLGEIPTGTDTLKNFKIALYGNNLTNHRYRVSFVDFATYATASFSKPRSYGVRFSTEF